MLTATIELRGFDEATQQVLEEVAQLALEVGAEQVRARLRERFLSEGRAYGEPWLPRKSGRERLPHRPLLFSSGRLRASFLEPHDPEHIEIIDATSDPQRPTLTFGSSVPYAPFHQWGTRHMPARTILTAEVLRGE